MMGIPFYAWACIIFVLCCAVSGTAWMLGHDAGWEACRKHYGGSKETEMLEVKRGNT